MPENMPDNQKASSGSSIAAKAAAVALGLSGALLLVLALAAALPEKARDWRAALPTPAMTEKDAEAAFLRARYLHEAAVRPRLIQAGLFSPDDAGLKKDRYGDRNRPPSLSEWLTHALWTMRTLPELHDAFLAMLLDTKTDPRNRADSFFTYAAFLASAADSLAGGSASRCFTPRETFAPKDMHFFFEIEKRWFAKLANDPRLKSRQGAKKSGETYEAKLALARELLPLVLESVVREMADQTAMAEKDAKAGNDDRKGKAWGDRHSPEGYLADLRNDVNKAMAAISKHREIPGFLAQAKEILALKGLPFEERYSAVPLIAEKPGLPAAEYVFWRRYKSGLRSVARCLGTSPRSYAYLLVCMDKLMTDTTGMMKANGTIILDGHQGPGVTLTLTKDFTPSRNLLGNLYLLADMAPAMKNAPAYDLSRAIPVFRGQFYRHMENQPLVLPLNLRNPADKAVFDWYNEKGWASGRMVLFSALGTPSEVAAHWGSIHLAWWESAKENAEPDPAFLHPVSGHFLTGLLPELKGKAASRVLGPVTGLWFGRRNVDKTGWIEEKYEARPEAMPVAVIPAHTVPLRSPILGRLSGGKVETAQPAYTKAAPTILIDGLLRKKLKDAYAHNYRFNAARRLEAKFSADESATPLNVFTFVDSTVSMLTGWGITGAKEVEPAVEYLWQYRNTPEISERIRTFLADEKASPLERLHKVRQALDLPEKKRI